jgi:hypothetical protein
MFVGMALRGYAEQFDSAAASKLKFMILATDETDRDEVLASAASATVAWAAFQLAIPTRPHTRRFFLMEGARIVGTSPVEDTPLQLPAIGGSAR